MSYLLFYFIFLPYRLCAGYDKTKGAVMMISKTKRSNYERFPHEGVPTIHGECWPFHYHE